MPKFVNILTISVEDNLLRMWHSVRSVNQDQIIYKTIRTYNVNISSNKNIVCAYYAECTEKIIAIMNYTVYSGYEDTIVMIKNITDHKPNLVRLHQHVITVTSQMFNNVIVVGVTGINNYMKDVKDKEISRNKDMSLEQYRAAAYKYLIELGDENGIQMLNETYEMGVLICIQQITMSRCVH